MQLILGSQSPRRKEILSFFNIPFKQVSPKFDEKSVDFDHDPQHYVRILSKGKADSLISLFPEAIILTADTIVYKGGKIYEKPKNAAEAHQYLKELCGDWHSVFTGLTVCLKDQTFQAVEETRVLFKPLTEDQMHLYHQAFDYTDKAGGYMAQGAGHLIINRIEGCYYNIVGLPINILYSLFYQAGIDLWQCLKRS